MKPKNINKLSLKKITISNLNMNALKQIHGGGTLVPECPPETIVYTNCWTRCATNCEQCPPDTTAETFEVSICPYTCLTC